MLWSAFKLVASGIEAAQSRSPGPGPGRKIVSAEPQRLVGGPALGLVCTGTLASRGAFKSVPAQATRAWLLVPQGLGLLGVLLGPGAAHGHRQLLAP